MQNSITTTTPKGTIALHPFNPDHNLFCLDCGAGELTGNHGMILGDGGASGRDFSPMYRDDEVREMYLAALGGLTEFEESGPDWQLRREVGQ